VSPPRIQVLSCPNPRPGNQTPSRKAENICVRFCQRRPARSPVGQSKRGFSVSSKAHGRSSRHTASRPPVETRKNPILFLPSAWLMHHDGTVCGNRFSDNVQLRHDFQEVVNASFKRSGGLITVAAVHDAEHHRISKLVGLDVNTLAPASTESVKIKFTVMRWALPPLLFQRRWSISGLLQPVQNMDPIDQVFLFCELFVVVDAASAVETRNGSPMAPI